MKNNKSRAIARGRIALLTISLVIASAVGLKAQTTTPRTLSYQGVLKTSAGNIPAGTRLLTVTFYGDANGNTTIWQSKMNTPVDENGVFNCMLGTSDNPLPDPATMDRPIWLGVSVDGSPELRPLSQITASVYALNVADSSITSSKMATDYVSSISVNGQKVTGKASNLNIIGGDGVDLAYDDASKSIVLNTTTTGNPNMKGKGSEAQGAIDRVAFTDVTNTVFSGLLDATTTDVLHAGTPPTYGPVNLGTDVTGVLPVADITGVLPVANGGTGSATISTWNLTGNAHISRPQQFVGTTDTSSALEIHVGDMSGGTATPDFVRVAEFQHGGISPNIIMGYGSGSLTGNFIQGNGSTIAGGGVYNGVNTIVSNLSMIGGGIKNYIHQSDTSFIGGGVSNYIDGSPISFVGGGVSNYIEGSPSSFVGGGSRNYISYDAPNSVIVGGDTNFIIDHQPHSAIVGGFNNRIDKYPNADYYYAKCNFIGGGGNNTISMTGDNDEVIPDTGYEVIAGGDSNTTYESFTFIGGGSKNYAAEEWSSISGGESNIIDGHNGSIVGGSHNMISPGTIYYDGGPAYSIVGGGLYNNVFDQKSGILGGDSNSIGLDFGSAYAVWSKDSSSVIGGGQYNKIAGPVIFSGSELTAHDFAPFGFIGGGESNLIQSNFGAIGGGEANRILEQFNGISFVQAHHSFIGGGDSNQIWIDHGVIGGGELNFIDSASPYSIIGGGQYNHILVGAYNSIVGGSSNVIDSGAYYSFIGGGRANIIGGPFSVIGGGDSNKILDIFADHNVIAGGQDNVEVDPSFGSIGGGFQNYLAWDAWASTIAGGIVDTIFSPYSTIGGGRVNYIDTSDWGSTISGGNTNSIMKGAYASSIGGGELNKVNPIDSFSVIGGGQFNLVDTTSPYSTISGGRDNLIAGRLIVDPTLGPPTFDTSSGLYNVIGGGDTNTILGAYSAIGGGLHNKITEGIPCAAIPGGDSLIANSFAQTVIGYNNVVSGTFFEGTTHVTTTGGIQDQPLFIIGNGDNPSSKSNAFTVSYDGHTTVSDNNGSGGATTFPSPGRPMIYGSSYQDNLIVAWGITSGLPVLGGRVPTIADFGVTGITFGGGVYTITLNCAQTLTNAMVLITPMDPVAGTFCGRTIVATPASGSPATFTVTVRDGSCTNVNNPFMFQVVGR